MVRPSRNASGDGRTLWRANPGRPYQVRKGTTAACNADEMSTSDSAFSPAGWSVAGPYHQGVPPRIASRFRVPTVFGAALLAVLSALASGCAGATFDPSGPCNSDGRAAGAYPDLEALVPREFQGRAPDRVDSGRNCTTAALATLALHDVTELRFAGAIWDLGSNSGVTLAVFEASSLEAPWVAEFFEAGARTARRVESVDVRSIVLPGGVAASRVDALNGESYQTVVVWPDGERVRVALVASFIREVSTKEAHDALVTDAIAAALGR